MKIDRQPCFIGAIADKVILHEQNPPVIHRDIKPSNILLTNRSGNSIGNIYLVDFGSVQTVASKDRGTITIVGSYGYIPLEQFGGQTILASDLYSLGMTLIYLLTGTHPAELPQIKGQIKFTAEISNQFKRWLVRMTQPDLDKRFDSAKLAQISLKSKDGSYGDFVHFKPAHSQVQLYCAQDKLELTWGGIERENNVASFLIAFLLVLLGIKTLATLLPISFVALFFYAFLIAISFQFIARKNQPIFKHSINYKLTINSEHIYRSKCRTNQHKSTILSIHPRSQIQILPYNPGYVFDKYLDDNGTVIRRGKVTILPKLYLYCGDFEYSLGDNLSQAELWWLGQELSNFLNLELQVIYPTPKVPPAPSCGGGC